MHEIKQPTTEQSQNNQPVNLANEVEKCTRQVLNQLYNGGQLNRAALASARSAATITNPLAQKVWPILLTSLKQLAIRLENNEATLQNNRQATGQLPHIPHRYHLMSDTGQPSSVEVAMYTAIHLYAIHQQGHQQAEFGRADDQSGVELFVALSQLRQSPSLQVALDRRIQVLLEMTNIHAVINSITRLTGILKANYSGPAIDYARLAKDLYRYQSNYPTASHIRLRWGQEYYATY